MGGAGMLAAGNYLVFRSVSQSGPHAISHLQVQVQVCWEVCSSPTLSTTVSTTVVTLAIFEPVICDLYARRFYPVPVLPTSDVTLSQIHLCLSQAHPHANTTVSEYT